MYSASVLFFVTFPILASGADNNDGCRQLTFTPEISGRALRRHVIRTLEAASCEWCQIQCFLERRCVSYNCGNNTCDLNSSDHVAHPADLVVDQCKTYQATELQNACKGNGCAANATCLRGFTQKGYGCECVHAGFKGDNCDQDIDECEEHTHNCSRNATCLNQVGSFKCECNSGYHGDGVHCSEIKYTLANAGVSCTDHCVSNGTICVEHDAFPSGSAMNITVELELGCATHKPYESGGHPAINTNTKNCLGTVQIPPRIDCDTGGNIHVRRICPCAEILQ